MNIEHFGDEDLIQMQKEYLENISEFLDTAENFILAIEGGKDLQENVVNFLRVIHTIKGTSGSYQLDYITTVCHKIEDLFNSIAIEQINTPYNIGQFLRYLDLIQSYAKEYYSLDEKGRKYYELQLEKEAKGLRAKDLESINVLFVEHSKMFLKQYRRAFVKSNVKASYAMNGLLALNRLLREKFDYLVSANTLNLIDGPSLIKATKVIKNRNQNITTILVTTEDYDENDFLKPEYIIGKGPDLIDQLKSIFKYTREEKVHVGNGKRRFKKVLYIDDDENLHKLFKYAFKNKKGFEIKCAIDGKNGLDLLESFNPDIICLDYMMPDLDGPSVLAQIRKLPQGKNKIVFYLTAKDDAKELEEMKKQGVNGIINKPFNPKNIVSMLTQLWDENLNSQV